jgi:hypothetical protein
MSAEGRRWAQHHAARVRRAEQRDDHDDHEEDA